MSHSRKYLKEKTNISLVKTIEKGCGEWNVNIKKYHLENKDCGDKRDFKINKKFKERPKAIKFIKKFLR